MEAFLDPATIMGLTLLRDELIKRQTERADLEALIANLQNQIKETKSLVEVIDLGNKLVYKEYQKMNQENTVIKPLNRMQFYAGENLSKGFTNETKKQEASEEQNYVNCLKQFNEENKKQL